MGSLLLLAGCGFAPYGLSGKYIANRSVVIPVDMPANAPSIAQQFIAFEHEGIDIWAEKGTAVLAAADGVVTRATTGPIHGNQMTIDHSGSAEGYQTIYWHLRDMAVAKGDRVTRGQQIGTMGSTGLLAAGITHLHFEVRLFDDRGWPIAEDPHLHWAGGVGKVTCFQPEVDYQRLTYPVVCR